MHFLLEAVLVGVVLVLVTYVAVGLTSTLVPSSPPGEHFNKYRVMEISIFVAGFLTHLLFEAVGMNKAYCTMGYACKK
jgi:hypothetical protein